MKTWISSNMFYILFIGIIFVSTCQGKCIGIGSDSSYSSCNDFEQASNCQYAQAQIDVFVNSVGEYYDNVVGINNTLIWDLRPWLGCGNNIAIYCNAMWLCESELELENCRQGTIKLNTYISNLKETGIVMIPSLDRRIPRLHCPSMGKSQTSNAVRRSSVFSLF